MKQFDRYIWKMTCSKIEPKGEKLRVCNIVLDSVWFDPRVRRALKTCIDNQIDIYSVGIKDKAYDEEKLNDLQCPVIIVKNDEKKHNKIFSLFFTVKRIIQMISNTTSVVVVVNPDVIHANDLQALIPAFLAKRKLKCKIVYDTHELATENLGFVNKPIKRIILKIMESYFIRKADLVVCVSHSAGRFLKNLYHIPMPMVVTNCALKVDETTFLEKNCKKFEILNHGQFYAGRGYDLCIKAGNYLKDYPEIQIVLRGYGNLENELRQLDKSEDSGNVKFDPPVLVTELISVAAKSHVGIAITEPICFNFFHSVSNKIFEYAAAGLPVIMSDIPEHQYLNNKYDFGIILVNNTPEALADAIIKIYSDQLLYKRFRNNAITMSRELNWENEFGKLIKKYKELGEDNRACSRC